MKILIVLSCILVAQAAIIDKLPSSLKICSFNDPTRNECIRSSIENFLSSLHQKQEGLDFPNIEPFTYDSITFNYNTPNFIKGWFTFSDQSSYGMSRAKILDVKSDFTDNEMEIQATVFFPKLYTTGNYKSNLTLGLLKIDSKGQFNVSMIEVTAKWTIKGKLESRNGEDYMKVYQFDVLPVAKQMKISISGMFPDESLNKLANEFLNQYWPMFYEIMIPETRKQWEPVFRDTSNKFFSQIPFRRLLLK